MSMAQPRTKEKWSKDPRNTQWANDPNKFGLRMMQKMGWTEGKGLGAREHGETQHVKVKRKTNALGVGATNADKDFAWLATQDMYSQLLANLNAVSGSDSPAAEPEPESEAPATTIEQAVHSAVRSRHASMFYTRFKRSKDTSNYSQDDLACILGGKSKRPKRLNEETDETDSGVGADANKEGAEKAEGKTGSSDFVTITRTESIYDYFARRTGKLGANKSAEATSEATSAVSSGVNSGDNSSSEDAAEQKGKDDTGDDGKAQRRAEKKARKEERRRRREEKAAAAAAAAAEDNEPAAEEEEEQTAGSAKGKDKAAKKQKDKKKKDKAAAEEATAAEVAEPKKKKKSKKRKAGETN